MRKESIDYIAAHSLLWNMKVVLGGRLGAFGRAGDGRRTEEFYLGKNLVVEIVQGDAWTVKEVKVEVDGKERFVSPGPYRDFGLRLSKKLGDWSRPIYELIVASGEGAPVLDIYEFEGLFPDEVDERYRKQRLGKYAEGYEEEA